MLIATALAVALAGAVDTSHSGEDEAVLTSSIATSGPGSVANALVLKRRFGSRAQLDFAAPFSFMRREPGGSWVGGIGDLSIGLEYTFIHSLASGTILSYRER